MVQDQMGGKDRTITEIGSWKDARTATQEKPQAVAEYPGRVDSVYCTALSIQQI